MQDALVGLVGLLIGVLLNEYFRRRNRVEIYSSKVFERRLEVYEGLMAAVHRAASEVDEALADDSSSVADRQERAFLAGLGVVQYGDEHMLYINDEILVHCGATFVGTTDILEVPEGKDREDQVRRFREMVGSAKRMIRAETGMDEIDRAFRAVTNAKHSSPVIEFYRAKKKEQSG